jgi:DNA-binding IclR family transcriptional regulator
VLVAFADPAVAQQLVRSPEWPESLDRRLFLAQLEDIRRAGYATSIEERESGAAAVSAPIFNRSGRLVAALSVSGPASRWTLEAMRDHAETIIQFAGQMGRMVK